MADLSTLPGKVQPVTEVSSSVSHYGVPDQMRTGFSNVKSALTTSHPLEATEKNFLKNQEMLDFKMLRNTQGLQAPLKLQMERAVASKIQRLPCLPSSMVALDTLMGTDESIGFEDFLNVVKIVAQIKHERSLEAITELFLHRRFLEIVRSCQILTSQWNIEWAFTELSSYLSQPLFLRL